MFDRPWDPACKMRLQAEHRRLFDKDQNARELWEELRRVVRKIENFLDQEKLWPINLDNLNDDTERAHSLACWFNNHGRSVRTPKHAAEVLALPESTRNYVIQRWEVVDPRYLPCQPTTLPVTPAEQTPGSSWKREPHQMRKLSVRELTVVSLLCGSWPKVSKKDLEEGIRVSSVIDRERKNIKNALDHLPYVPM